MFNVLKKSVHLKKLLLTIKNTYLAIAYICLDVSPPIFLLEKNTSKAFTRGLRCQNLTMHFATKTDVHGAPMSIVPRSPLRLLTFVCKHIVPRGRGHSKTHLLVGPTTYRPTSRLSSSFIVGFSGCHLSQQNWSLNNICICWQWQVN